MKYSRLAVMTVLLGCNGTGNTAPTVDFPITIRAQVPDGSGLADVVLESQGKKARTGANGAVDFTLSGIEGERREVSVACPEDYQAPPEPLSVSIRKLGAAARSYHYDVLCVPLRHTVVIVTRAINGRNLPILRLGREIGRTNQDGIAHTLLNVPAGESIRLTLDTESEELSPRSPSFDFPAVERDQILTINQTFALPFVPKATPRRPLKKHEDRPTRL
jgi:hypothetical protein